ncbi:uncharacterized protein NPIL_385411 [Nephila pilipes]|uniref:Uncharacterized protein n=1 Tax=Nephila pilipes TaxID=299642 RepID=A0A8X6QPT0_NEPPI|nr:uncharacterized protein NPIL_385411 [Nephila pilipes]
MKKETLNACWEKLCPECVHDCIGFSPNEIHQPLTDEDLAELTKSAEEEETEEKDEGLTLERLAELMRIAKELQKKAKSWDPYMVRSLQFSNAIDSSMSTYKTLFTTIKKTTKLAANKHVPNEGQEK